MEWYVAVILILSAAFIGGLIFIVHLVSMVDDLRIENAKLRIDLRRKYRSKGI